MKQTICIFIILFFALFIFNNFHKRNEEPTNSLEEHVKVEKMVKLLDNEDILKISLEDYIIGVVACEMPASFSNEALKAQSVASRTYALYKMDDSNEYDLENSTSNQCYITTDEMKKKWKASYELYYNKVKEAVQSTLGEYVTYNDKIIKALYFSTSNGYTEDVKDVFGENLEYLQSVESSWDINSSTYERELLIENEKLLKLLNIDNVEPITILIKEKSSTGRVKHITVNGIDFTGTKFRSLLGIRSTDFDIEMEENNVIIITRGYGHGVGMSQYGANGMAQEGYTYDEILKYFYKNTEIKNV